MNKKILRKFGFKIDQEGIINRYLRENGGWDEHLQKTKNQILTCSDKHEDKKKVVVLGSGWLLDVPVEDLAEKFEEVVLVDIVHPRQITNKLKRYGNVKFVESEVTGFVEPVYESFKKKKKGEVLDLQNISSVVQKELLDEIKTASYVVSVNLLNQLDILICDYINKFNVYSEKELIEFRKKIQTEHLNLLPENKSLLITDHEEINLGEDDTIINKKKLVHISFAENKILTRWKWNFDLKKTYHNHCQTVFKVMVVEI